MDFSHSPKTLDYLARVKAFIAQHIAPIEDEVYQFLHEHNAHGDWTKWQLHPKVEALKVKAREAGLANLFLPDDHLGQGLTTLEYAPLAEEIGRYAFAPEIFNCNAPDTGNMEVLYHFGTQAQKDQSTATKWFFIITHWMQILGGHESNSLLHAWIFVKNFTTCDHKSLKLIHE